MCDANTEREITELRRALTVVVDQIADSIRSRRESGYSTYGGGYIYLTPGQQARLIELLEASQTERSK
jgi:hypothetical protein